MLLMWVFCRTSDYLLRAHSNRMLTLTSYLYGGYGFGNRPAYDDVYILSLPSFTWIKVFPLDGSDSKPSQVGHGGCSANVINRAQMLVVGGWFPLFDKCDTPEGQGQHNMVLGYNGGDSKLWDKFDPQLDDYVVPSPIIAAIGGGYVLHTSVKRCRLELTTLDLLEARPRLPQPRGDILISRHITHSSLPSRRDQQRVRYLPLLAYHREVQRIQTLPRSLVA
jgi:hypothetical protein